MTPRIAAAFWAYQPGLVFQPPLDRGEQHLFLFVARLVEERLVALLGAQAKVDEQRRVAAVIEDHVGRAAVGPFEDAVGVVPIVFQGLAFDREHRRAAHRDRRRGVVLGRVDVARGPAHLGAERFSVSISTAVWIVMCSEPAMRAPLSGCAAANSARVAIRPGISVSAMAISLRP